MPVSLVDQWCFSDHQYPSRFSAGSVNYRQRGAGVSSHHTGLVDFSLQFRYFLSHSFRHSVVTCIYIKDCLFGGLIPLLLCNTPLDS